MFDKDSIVFTWRCRNVDCQLNQFSAWKQILDSEDETYFQQVKGWGHSVQPKNPEQRDFFAEFRFDGKHAGAFSCPGCSQSLAASAVSASVLSIDALGN